MAIEKIEICRLYRYDNGGPIKAYADVQFDDDFIVKGFKIVEAKAGDLFVGMPSEVGKSGKWFSTFLPLGQEFKDKLEEAIISSYTE